MFKLFVLRLCVSNMLRKMAADLHNRLPPLVTKGVVDLYIHRKIVLVLKNSGASPLYGVCPQSVVRPKHPRQDHRSIRDRMESVPCLREGVAKQTDPEIGTNILSLLLLLTASSRPINKPPYPAL